MLPAAIPYLAFFIPAYFLPDYLAGAGPSAVISFFILGLSVACFLAFRFLLFSRRASRFDDWLSARSLRIAWTASAVFMVLVMVCGVTKYLNFGFPGTDLGCFMQSFWTALHGELFRNSYELYPEFGSHLGKHFSVIMFLMIPFFAVFPHCITFFVLNAAALGLGSIVVFYLAKERLGRYCGLCFAISYLLYPGICYQAWVPYYFIQYAPLFLLLALYSFQRERMGLFCLFLILACSAREEIALTACMFGIYALVRRRGLTWVLLPIVVGAAWFALAMGIIIPRLGPGTMWEFYEDTGGSMGGLLLSTISDPASILHRFFSPEYLKLLYLLLMPLAVFLPLLGPEILFALPTLVIVALSSREQTRVIYGYYYLALVPFLFAAAMTAVGKLSSCRHPAVLEERDRKKLICTFVLFLSLAVFVRGPLAETLSHGLTSPYNIRSGHGYNETLRKVLKRIPPEAAVFTPRYLMPHLAKRMFLVPEVPHEAEYLLIDTRTEDPPTVFFQSSSFIRGLEGNSSYEMLFDEKGVRLYRRKGR